MLVRWRPIELEGWERKETFLGFQNYDFPYLVVGADIHLGSTIAHLKAQGRTLYLGTVYVFCRAANDVGALRQRIRNGAVIEHERVHADFTVPSGVESFTIKKTPFVPDFSEFYALASETQARTFAPGSDEAGNDHWIFMSCLPWIQFTHVVQPTHITTGSIPRFIWGRLYQDSAGQWKLPVTVQVHHGLVDGLHVGRFLQRLEALFADAPATFGP